MHAGKMDRRITIQRREETQAPSGATAPNWINWAVVWAQVIPVSGREYIAARQLQAERTTRFLIRWRAGVVSTMRILYDGQAYEIRAIAEIGRRDGLDIRAEAIEQ